MVAKTSLVIRPTRVERGAAKDAPTLRGTASAAQSKHIPSDSAVLQRHACRETIAKGIISAGFSKDVAGRDARGKLRQSVLDIIMTLDGRDFARGALPGSSRPDMLETLS